ncbi:MAG: formimidoylglutamate deiminase [Acidiphilium sp. 37-64-53]|uniref:formimidoylglutamate deiminase n=1 Tax=Acidiphilium TaxID=522 RepID=UPI000BD14D79|nr:MULTISPECIES: formimidoylglutamate deiminase [Acidiphilium]OYW03731.1 MAG: formimidoylglutamate deiminase [Acidiphilium sp. 37-64-53]OZB30441.1 MAG: formimidoylglutamate deiminase [Acidiphilium sp. 34-64-41]HQT83597.1 formimidoylglutamate deiminase [Acidiphilium rubrum]
MARSLWFAWAWLADGWQRDVVLTIDHAGIITGITAGAGQGGCDIVPGIAMPGLANLHSHGFQRAMAGLAERGNRPGEDFWSWRHVMYQVVNTLDPDEIEAVNTMAYVEMLQAGFTTVGEFHYVHHDPTGTPYAARAELAGRVIAAAQASGIGLTMLPCLYSAGGIGRAAEPGQRRFINDRDAFLRLHDETADLLRAAMPDAVLGVAPHSLRAARPADVAAIGGLFPTGPVHIHAAEQMIEVDDCLASLGAPPVAWLLDHAGVDQRWCLIHATHLTASETARLAASGAVAGLCPLTEADLGDGIFAGPAFLQAGGRFGIGSDSLIRIDAAEELRQLDTSQRLRDQRRVVLSPHGSAGEVLLRGAWQGGAQAMGQPIGALAVGNRADIVVLDHAGTDLAALPPARWLDHFVFVGGTRLIDRVYAGGRLVVSGGRHDEHAPVAARFRAVLRRLIDALAG